MNNYRSQQDSVWVATSHLSLIGFVKSILGNEYSVEIIPNKNIRTRLPACILGYCDFSCTFERCLHLFILSYRFNKIPFALIRELKAPQDSSPRRPEYMLDWIRNIDGDARLAEIMNRYSSRCTFPFSVQRNIIERKGRCSRVLDIFSIDTNPKMLARRFKIDSGIGLKAFMDRVRICNSLGELLCSDKCIKTIAIEFGYHPSSFSRAFYGLFIEWPSRVIREKRDPDLWK